jgi:hypothetical protein
MNKGKHTQPENILKDIVQKVYGKEIDKDKINQLLKPKKNNKRKNKQDSETSETEGDGKDNPFSKKTKQIPLK